MFYSRMIKNLAIANVTVSDGVSPSPKGEGWSRLGPPLNLPLTTGIGGHIGQVYHLVFIHATWPGHPSMECIDAINTGDRFGHCRGRNCRATNGWTCLKRILEKLSQKRQDLSITWHVMYAKCCTVSALLTNQSRHSSLRAKWSVTPVHLSETCLGHSSEKSTGWSLGFFTDAVVSESVGGVLTSDRTQFSVIFVEPCLHCCADSICSSAAELCRVLVGRGDPRRAVVQRTRHLAWNVCMP